ncbi:DNA repair protein RecO [Paenibacillus chitinolyticus]|uniref:DNA repair protein RecO n=1 Tax=Paenibacillus chitinolyticus TaxID=79263 RepID=UPI002DB754DB|nr:DNA repair protein RecO [Paenibacillus chitinolyticus]MEC0244222.1 DNA repair protein RecO [Paenibacillus chitinolyticus]
MLNRVQGIVLRSVDYGEGNKIITIYTRELGKVGVIARGVKKVKSRLGAVTQLFTYGDYVFYRQGKLGTLNHGEIIEPHHKLREDLYKSAYASYLVEMVDRMLGEEDRSLFLFDQLEAGLMAIEQEKDMQIVAHVFELKMLAASGYTPILDKCASCGRTEELAAFSAAAGGAMCSRCKHLDPYAAAVTESTLKLMRLLQQVDLSRIGNVNVKPSTKSQLKHSMRLYMDAHVDVRWKARSFLDQMDKYNI